MLCAVALSCRAGLAVSSRLWSAAVSRTCALPRQCRLGSAAALTSCGEKGKSKQVIVYTTPTCTWCTTLKTYLDQHQVRYRELNVAADGSAAEAMVRKSGQQGVPQTEINGQMIVGFDKARINQLLEIK